MLEAKHTEHRILIDKFIDLGKPIYVVEVIFAIISRGIV